MRRAHDVTIIGAGIIGLLSALELAQTGRTILILERHRAAMEASWAGGGIISPLYPWRYAPAITALATFSQTVFPDLIGSLFRTTGIDSEFLQNGMLVTATSESVEALAWGSGLQQLVSEISIDEASALEPEVCLHKKALWMPKIASVRTPRLGQALRQACINHPLITLEEDASVSLEGTVVDPVVYVEGRRRNTLVVVLAAGAWTGGLLDALTTNCPIKPMKGQMLLFSVCNLVSRIVLSDGRYAIPRLDGRVVFGSTLEDVGFARTPDRAAFESLHQSALEMIPSLKDVAIEAQWSGFRPGSPKGIPWIGPVSERLWVNSGHFRNGVVLAPASARLLADLITGRSPIVDPNAYQPKDMR
ncbi:FAD-dependent oxidoreductase [Litorivicinus sp.]|nr:FAD-dependent oxidoreductase [Litorivicinus sp.]